MNKKLVEVVAAVIENENNEILCAPLPSSTVSAGLWA